MEARTPSPTLEESTIVERVARIISSVRGTKPDYTYLAAELEPAIPFDIFGVVLLRHDRQAVRVTVCQKENGSWIAQCHQHPLEDSMVEQVLQSPVTVVKNYPHGLDGPPAQCGDALSGYHQLRATLIAPLVVGDRVLGTLELGSTIFGTYADETLQRLIEAVVQVLAAAIDGAQVGGSAEIQDRQRQVLKDVSSALTSKMDLSFILNQIVQGIATALNVASAIVTFDQHEGKLRLEAQSGLDPAKLRAIVGKKGAVTDQSIIGYTLRRRQPCVSHDIATDQRFPVSSSFTAGLGIRSIFSYPLVTGTTVYGALLLCSAEPGGFTPLKADILSLFASQATIAIHNGMLIESAHQRARFQHTIEQLERAYKENGDEQELLAHVRQESEHIFGISFSGLLHFISDHLLTRNERDLHAILRVGQRGDDGGSTSFPPEANSSSQEESPGQESRIFPLVSAEESMIAPSQQESVYPLVLLTQTAEAALARAEVLSELSRLFTQLKQSTEHIKDAWFVVDLQGLCIYMNPAAEVFCGVHMHTNAESSIEDLFADLLSRVRNAQEIRSYLHDFDPAWGAQGNVYQQDPRCVLAVEPVAHSADDSAPSDQYYQLSRHPLFNWQGTLIANVLQVHDVTAQVRDEKNKSALLSSVSHDLRTPLTTIKAAVTGLLQIDVEWDEQTRREILEEIDAEADHLGVLVNALIEMSRIEMGALVLNKEWCDIVEVLHGALIRLERILALPFSPAETQSSRASGVAEGNKKPPLPAAETQSSRASGVAEGNKKLRPIRTEFPPELPLIYADHVQLERVFYNLIEHIVRHCHGDGEILISIDTVDESTDDVTEAPRQYLRIKVIDRTCGVPISERERIFKTFYGLNLRGSGLGLAISRGIVEAHQGKIGLEEASNEDGLCYVFTLPTSSFYATLVNGQHTASLMEEKR